MPCPSRILLGDAIVVPLSIGHFCHTAYCGSLGYPAPQLGFCAESKELETWLKHCHERLVRERSLPSRQDAAWLHEFDRIEQVLADAARLVLASHYLYPLNTHVLKRHS